jgi:hypothetical protein
MRNGEFHTKKRRASTAVSVEIVQNRKNEENRYDGIQNDEEEIIYLRSLEPRFVKPLDVKNDDMSYQKERKNPEIVFESGNALGRIYRDNISIKPEKI